MDGHHFDALAKRLSSRRAALGGVLTSLLLPLEAAARGKNKSKGKDRGKGRDNRKEKGKGKDKKRTRASVQADSCWRTGACFPRKGANVSQCDLSGYSTFPTSDCTGCNLSRANLRGVYAQGVNFTKANLSGACLADANFANATFAKTTNLSNATFCNTTMPNGSINNSGCGNGTSCCQTCTAASCESLGKACGTWPDTCGGTISCGSCASGAYGDDGACQTCDVTCSGSASDCGTTLQAALAGTAATLYVCPGRYRGGFTIGRSVTVIGAGDGDDPARHTILDGNDTQRVVSIGDSSGSITLQDLRITGGRVAGDYGGGIFSLNSTLALRNCTLIDNHAANDGADEGYGGAISSFGLMTLTDCLVTNNSAGSLGGGIHVGPGTSDVTLSGTTIVEQNEATSGGGLYVTGQLRISEASRVRNNTADDGEGGGIYLNVGIVTLEGVADPSPIVVDNCHENCAGQDIPRCQSGGTCTA